MSKENGSPQEGSAANPNTRDSRRLSLWHMSISAHTSPSPENAVQGGRSEKPFPDGTPLNLRDLLKEGLSIGDAPEEARSWLIGFGDLKPGTDVSRRFLNLREEHHGDQGATSLLSLLIQWVPLWSHKAEKARKEIRNSKSGSLKDQKSLDWLLQYICDFLELGHSDLDPLELSRTVETTTTLCLNASRQGDINGGINILYTIMSHFEYPRSGLDQTLVVLCASAANLPEVPGHLFDCARILAAGDLQQDFMSTLYSFVRTPTLDNNSKNLSHARGATRLLRNLIDEPHSGGGFVLCLGDFLEQLHFAAQQGIFRFCYDILNALHGILSSNRLKAEIAAIDFTKAVDIIRLCLQMTPVGHPQAGIPRVTSLQIAAQEDEKDRQYERHFRDRETIAKRLSHDLLRIWDLLPFPDRAAIHELFLIFPQYAGQAQLTMTLDYAKDKYLSSRDHIVRRQYSDNIYNDIVLNHSLPSACRLKGIEVLVQSINSPVTTSPGLSTESHLAYTWILDKLLDQIDVERDVQVFETLLKSLDYMASNYQEAAMEQASTMRTVEKLQMLIIEGPAGVAFSDDLAILATKVLVTIFGYSIHTDAKAAVRAFEVLLETASSRCKSRPARLVSKHLLFRVRADDAGFIYITSANESQHIASALVRTRESAEAFNCELPASQRHSASSSSLSTRSDTGDPLWMYPDTEDVSYPFAGRVSGVLNVEKGAYSQVEAELDMDTWLMSIIRCLQADQDWETYGYTVVHAAAQLSNIALFLNSIQAVIKLRQVLCEQIVNNTFREPPPSTGLKKSDVALCMFNMLVSLIPYATMKSEAVQKGFGDDLVRAFLSGIGGAWEGTARGCIHALSLCSLEIPSSVATLYPTMIDKMSKNMTQTHLTTHILEFLIQVALLPEMHSNLNPDEIQMIFGICIRFLEKTREQQHSSVTSPPGRTNPTSRHSGMNFRRPPYRAAILSDTGLPQYAAALAYHNMIFWFLSLRLDIRAKYVPWIIPRLVWKNARGDETIDEQSQVLIDMMQRTAFSDLGETSPDHSFATPEDGPVSSASWIVGLSIVTAQTAGHTGKTQITKRQASGTTYAKYQQLTAPLPSHHRPGCTEIRNQEATTEILPPHIILQMVASAATTSAADQPLLLPQEDFVQRALESFDRIPTVTSHKIGVLYIGPGQTAESDFLANTSGSPDFERLLDGLGYVVSLEPPLNFNPQGLEYPRDGKHSIAWRDRVEEIIYHVPTMMPTDLEDDPQCITKKSHVGNCHVNIIFNRSGLEWDFDNFKSQLNYVNIVIRPACRGRETTDPDFIPGFYWVRVVTRDDLPNISPAADPKIISAAQLGPFVRTLALNANMFCQTWNTKDDDLEFPSAWRARFQQIKRLKERVMSKSGDKQAPSAGSVAATSSSIAPGASSGRRTPIPREKDGALVSQLDFSSWTI
ncbi:uncharacterized protein Z519_02453 [Cladophialophora bantiana CBS 173.52]|uniref:Rap-GAP domain-containing protein n=1 Tax=Cladophialophora bantiana (strain ATCC 10958 / CBS 173.52 / CDC B-1940 / NIH 8579) TaxID=1442370 RepID=A0A0D2F4E3_CLAB1|nr:uncharacterized protein Z519_02453 [Cladophialophora bantiana CBS 173.52]KIW97061.1 hypothetical protein Z519_02453 [Cladophialophora bantiana CBS 173.52]